jgi:hypothetical protein
VSFQITTLKVLAGDPEGRASLADLTRCVAILISSGADWSERMKRLAARAPGLDIFTSGYVLRDSRGWQITEAGSAFLNSLEAPASEQMVESGAAAPPPADVLAAPQLPQNVIQLADHKARRRRPAAA